MAAIVSIDASQVGPFAAPISTLTAADTISFKTSKKQLLVLNNTTAGLLTATIDGSTGTTVSVPGVGAVDVSAGKAIPVAANSSVAVMLNTISAYCQGIVSITGAATLKAQLFDV